MVRRISLFRAFEQCCWAHHGQTEPGDDSIDRICASRRWPLIVGAECRLFDHVIGRHRAVGEPADDQGCG